MLAIVQEKITNKILEIRGRRVMLDRDLAMMYGVETRILNQAVRRNIQRFPSDFMFQLSKEEFENWRSQIVMSNKEKMGIRRKPYVFTEQGIAMLSSVLNSERAIQVNIAIMRIFVKLREIGHNYKVLAEKIDELEKKYSKHDKQIGDIFATLRLLMRGYKKDDSAKKEIGFSARG